MPSLPQELNWIIQGGAAGALILLLYALRMGWIRSPQEVEAWKGRAERSEKQVDVVLPALEKLTDAVDKSLRTGGS